MNTANEAEIIGEKAHSLGARLRKYTCLLLVFLECSFRISADDMTVI